jgi:hypothetical protein
MAEITINHKQTETIVEQADVIRMKGVSSARSVKGFLQGKINHFLRYPDVKYSGREIVNMLEGLLNIYNHFHPLVPIEIEGWRGKSGFEVIKIPQGYKVIEHRKSDPDSEVKEIAYTVYQNDITAILKAMAKLFLGKEYQTREVAQIYCLENRITKNAEGKDIFQEGTFNFSNVSGCRATYFRFYYSLKVLEFYKMIEYKKSGKIRKLKDSF